MIRDFLNSDGLFYVIFAFIMAVTTLAIIPRQLYKKFFLYGLIFGGLADVVIANTATLVGLHQYKGFGPFGLFGVYSLWTPITWTFAFMLFFYFLPVRNVFLVPYILTWSALNYSVGLVMQNLNLFKYIGIDIYIAPIIFIAWYSISAWVYIRYENRIMS